MGALQHTAFSSLHALGRALVTTAIYTCKSYRQHLIWGLKFRAAGSLDLLPKRSKSNQIQVLYAVCKRGVIDDIMKQATAKTDSFGYLQPLQLAALSSGSLQQESWRAAAESISGISHSRRKIWTSSSSRQRGYARSASASVGTLHSICKLPCWKLALSFTKYAAELSNQNRL